MDDPSLADAPLAAFGEFLAERLGLHFPDSRRRELEQGLAATARDLHCRDAAACLRRLLDTPWSRFEIEILARHLTVGETYFFREKEGLEVLERRILPELIAQRRRNGQLRLGIWSAGCCTGEELYSIAILVSRLIPDLGDWSITLLGTDINPRFLRKARRGAYGEWSFRNPPAWLKPGYFTRDASGQMEILPAVRALASFAYHNLAEDDCPAPLNQAEGVDIVFCRNVLMYFEPRRTQRVVAKLYRCLAEGGWLLTSPVEASIPLCAPFRPVRFAETMFYRKPDSRTEPAEPARFPPPEDESSWFPPQEPPPRFPLPPAPKPEPPPAPDPWAEANRLYRQGHYDEAAEILIRLLAGNPAHRQAPVLLARIRANQGKLDEALDWCAQALRADRLDPAAHYLEAHILMEQNHLDLATAALKRVLYLDPEFAPAHYALGNLLQRQGKTREADKHFANANELLAAQDP